LVEQIKTDYGKADLDERTRAMLDFAVLMTKDVHRITEAYIDGLRAKGLSDEDVLNVAEVTGFFNYYTRLADALGVDPEDFMSRQPQKKG
jgi:uncharacterized peroxidase-related enzyme